MPTYYSIITNNGLAKNAAASISGVPLDLTHLAVGDSNGTSYDPSADATALQNELYRTTTTYVVLDENNPNQLIVEAVISEEIGPFYIREVGIFDANGDLFAIGKFPETFKPNLPSGSGKRLYIRMILGFTGSPQVNLIISDDINNDPNFATNVNNSLAEKLAKAENLADLENVEEARSNLELGDAALKNVGSTNGQIPLIGENDKLDSALLEDSDEESKGVIQIASQSEVDTGSNNSKAVTPATLKSRISSQIRFGDYSYLTLNTVYQASYDGFVFGWQGSNGYDFRIYTGLDNPPSTVIGWSEFDNYCGPNGTCAPIKKGNYYKVTSNGGSVTALFIPILNS